MPRKAAPKAPSVRSDGIADPGNVKASGQGQPNGSAPRSAVTQVLAGAGAGMAMPYGQGGALQQAAAQTPAPPGVSPVAHAAHTAMQGYRPNVTPMSAPTQRPMEPVTAGAPLDPGPTNPMAMSSGGTMANISVAQILQQAAAATGNPALQRLAQRALEVSAAGSPIQ